MIMVNPNYWLKQARDEVKRNSMSPAAWNNLAMQLIGINDQEALQCLDKARSLNLRGNPHYSIQSEIWMWLNLSKLHEKLGLVKETKADLEAVRELYKEMERTMAGTSTDWQDLARDYMAIYDHDEAIRCLEQATAIDPGYPFSWRDLGALYRKKDDLGNAKRCFEAAIQAIRTGEANHEEGFAAELWRDLAIIDEATGDTAGAEQCHQKEVEMQDLYKRALIEDQKGLTKEQMAEQHEAEAEEHERRREELDALREQGIAVADESYRELDDEVRDAGLPEDERDALASLAEIIGLPMERFDVINNYTIGYMAKDGHVTALGLNRQPLKSFPEAILQLAFLKRLNLRGCGIKSLPEGISRLKSLQELDLGRNELVSIPDTIGELNSLTYLSLDNNRLHSFPDTIGELVSLTSLCLNDNQLESIPERIGELKALTYLMLDDNQLGALPETIGDMESLEALCVRNNRLETLPMAIVQLKKMTALPHSGNPMSVLPTSIKSWIGEMERRIGVQIDAPLKY